MALNATAGANTADSYFTIAEADTYFSSRGVTAWESATPDRKEQIARLGTSYLDNQYRDRWIGRRANETQSLAWPRIDGVRGWGYPLLDSDEFDIPIDAVPVQIKQAAMEAALLALQGVTLEPRLERGGAIKSIGKGVGPLRKDIVYMDGASLVDRYTVVEGLLRGLVKSTPGASSGTVRIVRA